MPILSADMEDEESPAKKKEPRKSVLAVQVGDHGYRIERTTNYLALRVGILITSEHAQKLIAEGINFTVARNK